MLPSHRQCISACCINFLLLLSLIAVHPFAASAGKHVCDCSALHRVTIDIAHRAHGDETFQSKCDLPSAATVSPCEISAAGMTSGNSQLLLQAVAADGSAKTSLLMNYQIQGAEFPVRSGLVHAVSLSEHRINRIPISVQLVAKEANVTSNPVELRAVLIKPGYCARDMLSFRGYCYTVSTVKGSTADALYSIGGDAELARFDSMSEISQLIAANTARAKGYPFKLPLSLDQPIRINLFLSTADDAQLSAVRNGSRCELRQVASLGAGQFRKPGRVPGQVPDLLCASLQVPSDLSKASEPLIDFVRCDTPMQSLVSFPEVATDESIGFVQPCDIDQTAAVRGTAEQPRTAAAEQGKALAAIGWGAAVAVFAAVTVGFGFMFLRRRSRPNQRLDKSVRPDEVDGLTQTQA